MLINRKMNAAKRVAFVAGDNNRKSLIEWSYYNQEILKDHELIATGAMADILEGTVGVPVTRLHDGAAAANHQLAGMITTQQIDVLLFFWDPVAPLSTENGVRALHDMAVTGNIIIATNLATADFILSSQLMNKPHSVPVLHEWRPYEKQVAVVNGQRSTQVVLKVNTIH